MRNDPQRLGDAPGLARIDLYGQPLPPMPPASTLQGKHILAVRDFNREQVRGIDALCRCLILVRNFGALI